jgi:sec-independent protein translocase protein TatB
MFDVSWGELLIVGAVALVVIGPKDLPAALRTLGQATAKLKRMAAEFQGQFNDAMREAELEEIRKQVTSVADAAQNLNPVQAIQDQIKGVIEDGTKPSGSSEPAQVGDAKPAAPPPEAALKVADLPAVPDPQRAIAEAAAPLGAAPADPANVKSLDINPDKNPDKSAGAERKADGAPAAPESRTNAA